MSTVAINSRKVGFYVADAAGQILEANDEFLLMMGSNQDELAKGRLSCRHVLGEAVWSNLEKMLAVLDHQGYIEPFEINFSNGEGSEFSAVLSITALRDGSGRGAYLVQNMTSAKQTRGILDGIFQETSDLIAAVDLQCRYIAFNQAFRFELKEKYGIALELGMEIAEVFSDFPKEQATTLAGFERALRGEAFTVFFEADSEDHAGAYYEVTFGAIRDNNQIIGAFQFSRNRTQQRKLELDQQRAQAEILRLNQALKSFEDTFEQAAVGIAHMGSQGEFLLVNQKYCDILGYPCEEILGLACTVFTPEADRARDKEFYRKLFSGALHTFSYDKRYLRKNGSLIWVHLTVKAVKNIHGKTEYSMVVAEDITERKYAEEALSESGERFRILANASPAQIFDMAPDGALRFINREAINFYGAEQEQALLEGTWNCHLHPDDMESTLKLIQHALKTRSAYTAEVRVRNREGAYRWLLCSAIPSFYSNGDFYGLVGSNLDITERKQVEEALRESEERFRILANASPAQIYDVAPSGKLRFLNKTALDFHGPERAQEVLEGDWMKYVHPDDRESLAQPTQRPSEPPCVSQREFRIQRQDGAYRWVLSTTAPSFYPSGEMYGLVGTAIDITERKQMEEALQKSKARWQDLANAVPLTIWVANAAGELIFVNERWYEYSGLSPEQSLGTERIGAVHPDDRESFLMLWAEHIQRRELFEIEVRYRHAMGSYRWHLVRAVPTKDAHGEVLNWYGTCMDIQDRRLMEQELAKARDIAEDVSRKKSQFLANMSHELRTPLNAVIGFSDMLNRGMAGELTQKQNEYVQHIATSGRHLLTMVNDILDISKAEAGRIDIFLQYLTLEPFIKQLKELVSFIASKNKVTVSFQVQTDLIGLIADPDRLKQIFINLICNGIKFNREYGSVQVFISRSDDHQWVICKICDNGIGIPADKIKNLFSEFYQVDSSNARQYEGTGLGLALTKKLVDLHQGEISVESEEGVGSTFTFKLPLNPAVKNLQVDQSIAN